VKANKIKIRKSQYCHHTYYSSHEIVAIVNVGQENVGPSYRVCET